MTSENSVPFKVYLIQNDTEPEIRRFSVPKDVVTSYFYLKQKLGVVFPSLINTPFIICWRDREGDQIQIWSDEELFIALTEMDGDNKKLYIIPSQNYSQPQPDPKEPKGEKSTVHFGVTCDGCEKEVVGFRYKCVFCSDYDLCQECEAKHMHNEHYMVRIPVPTRDIEFGKKLMKEFFKFNRHATKCDREFKRGGGYHHRRGGSAHCPFTTTQSCPGTSAAQGDAPSRSAFFEQALPALNIEGIVESVMQGLMRMAGAEVPDPSTKEKPSSNVAPPTDTTTAATPQAESTPIPIIQTQNSTDTSINPTPTTSTSGLQSTVTNLPQVAQELRTMENSNNATPVAHIPRNPSEMDQDVDNTWTVLNKDTIDHNAFKKAEQSQRLVELQHEQPPPRPVVLQQEYPILYPAVPTTNAHQQSTTNIEDSLNQMLSMGFSNEGDFLRQLLIRKQGSIEKVLDLLMPSRKSGP